MPGEFIFPKHSNKGKLTSCRECPTRNNFCVLANNYRSLVNAASNNGAAPSTNAASSLMLAFVRLLVGESDFWKVCLDDEGSGEKRKMSNLNLLTPVNSNQESLVAIVSKLLTFVRASSTNSLGFLTRVKWNLTGFSFHGTSPDTLFMVPRRILFSINRDVPRDVPKVPVS